MNEKTENGREDDTYEKRGKERKEGRMSDSKSARPKLKRI